MKNTEAMGPLAMDISGRPIGKNLRLDSSAGRILMDLNSDEISNS